MPKERIIAVDLDGVLADMLDCFFAYIEKKLAYKFDRDSYYEKYNVIETITQNHPDLPIHQLWLSFWKSKDILYMSTFAGNVSALNNIKLYQPDMLVVILTNRQLRTYHSTASWLSSTNIMYDALICGTEKAEWLLTKRNDGASIEFLIDDKPDNVYSTAKLAMRSYLLDRPYNQNKSFPGVKRVSTVADAIADWSKSKLVVTSNDYKVSKS